MNRRVLIVDDEFGLAEVVAEMLSERGFETTLAINGQLALDLIREQVPDLVLLDCMMPILDGTGVVRALRADPKTAAVPIILMTALPHVVPPDVQATTCALLSKPFSPGELFAAIERCLAGH
ncbi:MAG TPA: response regulator [Kofleriaceae bacterium]|nr:response regulator [Kofleriaceae bacterium]